MKALCRQLSVFIIYFVASLPQLQAIPDELRDECLALWDSEERMAPYAKAISRIIDVLNEGKHVLDGSRYVQPVSTKRRTPGGLYLQTYKHFEGYEIPMHLWTPFGSVRLLMDAGPSDHNRLNSNHWPETQKCTDFFNAMESIWKLEEVVTSLQFGYAEKYYGFDVIDYDRRVMVHHWVPHRPNYVGYRLYRISKLDDLVLDHCVEKRKFGKPILFREIDLTLESFFNMDYQASKDPNDARTIRDLRIFMKLVALPTKRGGPAFGSYGIKKSFSSDAEFSGVNPLLKIQAQ